MKSMKKLLAGGALVALSLGMFSGTYAADSSELSVAVSAGTLSVDITDDSGTTVATPTVTMSGVTSGFGDQTTTGTLGVSGQRIAVFNPTDTETWSVTIAATTGATAVWQGATYSFDFNEPTPVAGDGSLTVDPSVGTAEKAVINPADGSFSSLTASPTGITLGTSDVFEQGTTDSITVFTAGATADDYAVHTLTGVSLSQNVPSGQEADTYTLDLTLTVS